MATLYPKNPVLAIAHDQTLLTVMQGLLVPMADGSFSIEDQASREEVIEGLRKLRSMSAYTSCHNSFTVGDYWNQIDRKYGARKEMLEEAFGVENVKQMYQFFAPKGSIAKACPAPRDYSLPWNYYKRKAASQQYKNEHAVGTLLFQAMCTDTEGVQNGLVVEREGDNLIIRCEDSDDIMIPMQPIRDLVFDEYRKSRTEQRIHKDMLIVEARAAYVTDLEHDDFADALDKRTGS